MAQHDYVIANGTGAAVRSDLNNALAAIVSQNSGATEPATTYAYQWWADTTTNLLKLRNSANSGWITLFQLDGEWSTIALENGTAGAPSLYFKDSGTDTGFYSPGANQVGISTGGTAALVIDSSQRVGLGTSNPVDNFAVGDGTVSTDSVIRINGGSNTGKGSGIRLMKANTAYGYIGSYSWLTGLGTSNNLAISTTGGADLIVDTTGKVGIGTTSPSRALTVFGSNNSNNFEVGGASGGASLKVYNNTTSDSVSLGTGTTSTSMSFDIGGFEAARFDTSKRLLVGTSTSPSLTDGQYSKLHVVGNTNSANGDGFINIGRGVLASTGLTTGTSLGNLQFTDSAGAVHAVIGGVTDGSTGTNDYPGRLVFSTTADGASSPTERMRITSAGNAYIGRTADNDGQGISLHADGFVRINRSSAVPLVVNRNGDDGTLVELRQADVVEGTISVSGTTVSYNGAHLSRWSQLPGGATREEILRGTVLSNLDEMCDWGEEENEQLNRMKVSDVEGDLNVAGVFQAWDDDDDTYTDDFYCAMTGDFIIRIAESVTVQRGDLLMSAGDGTAKPQDDDIIRSKTIAKVTSTHVTCTYEDGSYCVPCVLMAC